MNIAPLLLLWWLSDRKGGGRGGPPWPSPKHPPPLRPHAHAAHEHAAHAAHAAHAPEHAAAHEHAAHAATPAHEVVHAPLHHVQPHVVHHEVQHDSPGADVSTLHVPGPIFAAPHAEHSATHLHALHHAPPEVPSATTDGTSVASVQAILRGLGWKGRLVTHGPLSPDLTDGLAPKYEHEPSATRDNWQASAHKRQLNPLFERLGPNTVRVDPDTYNALNAIAAHSGTVVGTGGRRLYIP